MLVSSGGEKSEGLFVPSSGFLNPFWQLRTQRAESWNSRAVAKSAPRNLVKRPFRNCFREMEANTEKVYRLPWFNNTPLSEFMFSFVL